MNNQILQYTIRAVLLLALAFSTSCQKSSQTMSLKGNFYGDKIKTDIRPLHPIHLKNAVIGHVEDLQLATDKSSRRFLEFRLEVDSRSYSSVSDPVLLFTINSNSSDTKITLLSRMDLGALKNNEEVAEISVAQ